MNLKKDKIIVIAEAGVNHNGKLKNALRLVDIAAESNADFVKFQIFVPKELTQEKHKLANYQKKNTNFKTHLDLLSNLSLKFDDFRIIKDRCKKKGIRFLASPFDLPSINFLKELTQT